MVSKGIEDKIRRRRSFLPALILGVLFLVGWLTFLFFVPPQNVFLTFGFVALLFLSLLFFSSLLMGRTRRGLVFSLGVVLFLVLGYFGAGNWLNFILLTAIGVTLEYYLSRRR